MMEDLHVLLVEAWTTAFRLPLP